MDVIFGNLDLWGEALGNTLILFFGGGALALVLGFIVAAMRVSPVPIARAVAIVYVNWIRNTPLTLVFFFFVFAYPQLDLVPLDYIPTAIVALGVYTATYVAEAIRAGINTVQPGQAEAARAIGLPYGKVMTLIVLPQAVRAVVPPMISVFIALLKNTTVAAGFSVAEMAAARASISDSGDRPGTLMEILLLTAAVFVALVMLLSWLQRALEKKWRIAR
ncbi:amino acid ABC transporter permease [Microbacterium mitrae]|uniref:Amino acid ABC transporter permease n=1 Tax=Microbacterium mitrae TaxID=664640 RepID=A0A5C8HQ58_9MICO|nr:amino acid ABC transporter permease [Microbacterium mitrae]TXK04685.1 amino acid ABC transporter permease [Microbacterium mitrae]